MIPRPEYPRPQFVRDAWMNLNGTWEFEIDQGCSGEARGLAEQEHLAGSILVPFCPESRLSGVEHRDFMACVWYKRTFALPAEAEGKTVLLHFGAADYRTKVWVNGKPIGQHEGGYTSFEMDITAALREGENLLTVCCEDNVRDGMQPNGKQSREYFSHGCDYTRTTGIWQTVWLEWVNPAYMRQVLITPDAANGRVRFGIRTEGAEGAAIRAEAWYGGESAGTAEAAANTGYTEVTVQLNRKELWNAGDPRLYDYRLTLTDRDGGKDELTGMFIAMKQTHRVLPLNLSPNSTGAAIMTCFSEASRLKIEISGSFMDL